MKNTVEVFKNIDNLVWGIPLIVVLLAVGVFLTIRLKGIQIRKLPQSLKAMMKSESNGNGEVSPFAAICIVLSATIGTGNIVGVATAILFGGPGALFWLIIGTIFGLVIKYAEGFLAIRYRRINNDGTVTGGPFAYIEYGIGKKHLTFAKILAKSFAVIGAMVALFGIGTLAQVSGVTDAIDNVFSGVDIYSINLLGKDINIVVIIAGLIITVLTALVVFGGVKRIANVCTLVVPVMAVIYTLTCLIILILNIKALPNAILSIIQNAFIPQSFAAGTLGITFKMAIQHGVSKGLFSNEAGLGSAPIALSTSKSSNPVAQGLSLMGGTIVTLIICTMTGLVVIINNSWMQEGLEGINITIDAFQKGLPLPNIVCSIVLLMCIFFFAFTSMVGWNMYGMKCLSYLTSNKIARLIYQVAYIIVIFIAPYLSFELIWYIADITCALMVIPNLIAIVYLSKVVVNETNDYFKKKI